MRIRTSLILAVLLGTAPLNVMGQTSSLGARERKLNVGKIKPVRSREAPDVQRNAVYARYSWVAVPGAVPKTFKVGDLLTVIVRESREFEADSELSTRKKFDLKTSLGAFIKPITGGLGAATFRRGRPDIKYAMESKLRSTGDATREDTLTTRITATIIDVKPNGLLVLEARAKIVHDDEISKITLTGTCRKADVTADNTVLSTQMASKVVVVDNRGALRAASSRGWFNWLVDFLKPF